MVLIASLTSEFYSSSIRNHNYVSSHESVQRKTKHQEHKERMREKGGGGGGFSEWHLRYSQGTRERQRLNKSKRIDFQSPNGSD